jgi:hypothetical protein
VLQTICADWMAADDLNRIRNPLTAQVLEMELQQTQGFAMRVYVNFFKLNFNYSIHLYRKNEVKMSIIFKYLNKK